MLIESVNIRSVRVQDLELLISWRSNPEIYEQFKEQDSALNWEEHISWFASRDEDRHDYIIEYKGRRVGSVYIDEDRNVGVYVGETALHSKGIGTYAINWAVKNFDKPLYAEIRADNKPSQAAFEKCGFEEENRENDWIKYRLGGK